MICTPEILIKKGLPALRRAAVSTLLVASIALSSAAAPAQPAPAVVNPAPSNSAAAPASPSTSAPGVAPLNATAVAPMTLQDVVALAINNNSTIAVARERLRKAGEQIKQVDAQALPQIRADVVDSLSSQATFGASGGVAAQAPVLPGGGQIPTVIDQGGGNLGTFIGGGGGGNAPSTGTTGTTTATPSTGAPGTTTTAPSTPGTTITTPGTINTTPGTTNTTPGATVAPPPSSPTSTGGTAGPLVLPRATTPTQGQGGQGGNSFGSGHNNNYGARISLSQYIDIYNLVPTARDVTRITRDFYILDLDRQSNELAFSAKSTFFSVLRAQAAVNVQMDQVAAARESLRIAQVRFTTGVAPQFDVVSAQTVLSNAEQNLSSAQNQLDLARANLNSLIGSNLDAPVVLQEPPLPLNQTIDLGGAVQTAYTGRPELRQAENNITIAQKLIKLTDATQRPSLGVSGSANYSGPPTSGVTSDTYTISADLGVPLFDGGDTRSRVRSAQSDLAIQRVTLSQLQQNVALEVRQAYLNVNDAKTRIAATTQGAVQAAEALRLANVRYQNDLGTILDVTNAQSQLATARTNLLNAQYDYQTSLAQLARAEGTR